MATVDRKELESLLSQVAPGVGAKESTLQETCFAFSDGYVFTYNDEICLSAPLPEAMSNMKPFAVQAKEFQAIIGKLKDKTIKIELSINGLEIQTKRAKMTVKVETAIRMPINEIQFPEKFIPLPDKFSEAVRRVLPVVGKDMTKPMSTALHFYDNKVEASDVDKAARYTFKDNVFKELTSIPRLSAGIACRFEPTGFNVTEGWMHFEKGAAILSCRTYHKGQALANIDQFLNQQGVVLVLPPDLPDALDRAGVFISSADGAKVTHEDKYADVHVTKGLCIVSGEGGIGQYEEQLEVDYDDDDLEFVTDVNTLLNAVSENQTCEICDGHIKIFDKNFSYIVSFGRPKQKNTQDDDDIPF